MKTTTLQQHTQQQRQEQHIREIENEVCELLHWNHAKYCGFVYDTGLAYLVAYFGSDKEAIALVECRKQFWTWWRAGWILRDMAYLDEIATSMPLNDRVRLYHDLHQPAILAAEIHPNRTVLGEDFATIKMKI
jgi:hypothetical protein